jgi:Elongation factor Tu GTP binding domain
MTRSCRRFMPSSAATSLWSRLRALFLLIRMTQTVRPRPSKTSSTLNVGSNSWFNYIWIAQNQKNNKGNLKAEAQEKRSKEEESKKKIKEEQEEEKKVETFFKKKEKEEEEEVIDHKSLNQIYPDVQYADIITGEESKQDGNRLNLVIIGHVDSGKSTLMGHILFKMGRIDQ